MELLNVTFCPAPPFQPFHRIEKENQRVSKKDESQLLTVGSIARRIFPEIALAFSLNYAVVNFVAIPLTVPLFTLALATTLAAGCIALAYDYYRKKGIEKERMQAVQKLSRISIVNTVGLAGPNIVIHESGHALAASALFKNAQPLIEIDPFNGGATSYAISYGLTRWGNFLGQRQAMLVIAAAGLIASTIFALFEFGLAHKLQHSYPLLSQYLNLHGISQILNEVIYGLTAFFADKIELGHDFIYLWQMGEIHPLIPIALIIAIPLFLSAILGLLDRSAKAKTMDAKAKICLNAPTLFA